MAKKKTNDNDYYNDLAKETGGEILNNLGKIAYFIDTGNLSTNFICSGKYIDGGIPGGKIIEAFGPESSGKSLWGLRLIASVQQMDGIGAIIDTEAAVNPNFAKSIGQVDTEKTLLYTLPTYEQIEAKIRALVTAIRTKKSKEVPVLIIWDSISPTMCEREWREIKLPEKYTQAQFTKIVKANEQPGERAKAAGKVFRKLTSFLAENNVTLYCTNQVREKIGVMFGSPETTGGGGRALPFYASIRLRMQAKKKIEDSELNIPLGVNLKVTNKKNRSFKPFLETEGIQLYFDNGINPLGGLLSVLIGDRRVAPAGKGIYKVDPRYTEDEQEYTFKASKERNDVPVSLVLDCPKIINASSREQVEKYLALHMESIEISNSSTTKEVSMGDDEEGEPSGFDFDEIMGQAEEE